MAELNIISYNVKGLREKVKRITIFNYLKEKLRDGIVCLQETHSSPEAHASWRQEWESEIYFNDNTSNSAGVAILIDLKRDYEILKYFQDDQGRIQILSIIIDDQNFLIINIYNHNLENEQVQLLENMNDALDNFGDLNNYKIIMSGDLNFIYDRNLDATGGNPTMKLRSLAKITKICEEYDLCDIFRIRHPTHKRFTFRTINGNIHRRLDHFLISNIIQESVKSVSVLPSVRSDHSPILLIFKNFDQFTKGPGLWKFNNSLLQNEEFCIQLNENIDKVIEDFEDIADHQLKWELLKFKIRCFAIKFSKKLAKEKRKRKLTLENVIKDYEAKGAGSVHLRNKYLEAKNDLEFILENEARGSIIRSKCLSYEQGEKSSKYFLNLEKTKATKGMIRSLVDENNIECTETKEILKNIEGFYEKLLKKTGSMNFDSCKTFLNQIEIPVLNENNRNTCDAEITVEDLYISLCSMGNDKTPGNDGLSKELYVKFWDKLKNILFKSLIEGKKNGELSVSQRQAVIKLL